jgi:hypothetical protein
VTATAFAGNATTASALAASVNIGGVAFDGSAAIVPTTFTTATFSGDVAFDTNTLFVDSTNNRVGVGTSTPGTALEVFSTSGTQVTLRSDSRYSTIFAVDDTGSSFFGNDRGAIRFTTGGDTSGSGASEKMRILANGNVGIGTTDPGSYKLDVNGTAHLPSIHRTNFTKELSEYFELVSGTTSTVTLNSLLVEINVTGTGSTDMSEYAGTIDLDIIAQRTNSSYGMDVVKTQLHFAAAWNEQSDGWHVLEFNQEIKAQNINSYRTITSVPVFRYTYIARKLQIYIQYNALQYRVKHSFTARVSSDEAFAGDIISYAGGGPMSGTDAAAVAGISYGVGGNIGIGTSSPATTLELNQGSRPGDSSSSRGMRWSNTDNSNYWSLYNSNNDHFRFAYNGAAKGWVDPNDPNSQMNFTGQHRTFVKDVPFSQVGELEGLIVSSDQNKYIKMSGGIEVGSNAITTNESLPVVSLSIIVTDKKCFGVISASEDPENRTEQYGAFGTNFEKEKGDTRVYINSVGEGAIWVTNINGPLESGDYITTSNVAGYGMKQESDSLKNYTVAKITMDCDFSPVTQPIQNIKKDETGENTLDEHGQIQWEDHAIETEKAYKIRYLDANGVITDEANVVHTAAFVGCTYHCG